MACPFLAQAPEHDDPTAAIVSGPSSSQQHSPTNMTPNSSEVELSQVCSCSGFTCCLTCCMAPGNLERQAPGRWVAGRLVGRSNRGSRARRVRAGLLLALPPCSHRRCLHRRPRMWSWTLCAAKCRRSSPTWTGGRVLPSVKPSPCSLGVAFCVSLSALVV
jgi:hypothetical protein